MDQLPIELVTYILQTSAYQFRSYHRQTVVSLAQSSSHAYETVAPILYERVIITHDNELSISTFMHDEDLKPLAERVFKHTRFLYRVPTSHSAIINAALFPRAQVVYGSIDLWSAIAAIHSVPLGDVRLWTVHLNVPAPASALCNITRMHIFHPTAADYKAHRAGWIRRALEMLPALTHLGFSHVEPAPDRSDADVHDGVLFGLILGEVVRCQVPKVQVVALRLTGHAANYLSVYAGVAHAAVEFASPQQRVLFWVDRREILSWRDEVNLMVDDARAERSIWTEAKPHVQPHADNT